MACNFPIYILNLKRDQHRRESLDVELAKHDLQYSVTYVNAIDGMTVRPEYYKDKISSSMKWFGHPSIKGCALSHLSLWEKMVREKIPRALIMEDDVRFLPNFKKRLISALQELPSEADVLYVGAMLSVNRDEKMPWYVNYLQKAICIGKKYEETQAASTGLKQIYQPQVALGTHCYLLNLKGAQKLVDNLKGQIYYHIDYMMMTVPSLSFFVCHPVLATQKVDMCSSSIAKGSHFPFSINAILDEIPHISGVSNGYLLSHPIFAISGQVVNAWVIFFFVVSLICVLLKISSQTIFCLFTAFVVADATSSKILTRQILGVDSIRSVIFCSMALSLPYAILS